MSLPAHYVSLPAAEKLALLWERVVEQAHGVLPTRGPSLLARLADLVDSDHLAQAITHPSDELPAGRSKRIHGRGACALVRLVFEPDSPCSGLLRGEVRGLLRASTTTENVATDFNPGLAIKLPIDGQDSLNLFFAASVDGQGRDGRFFARPMLTRLPPARRVDVRLLQTRAQATLDRVARRGGARELPLDGFAAVDARGSEVPAEERRAPAALELRATAAVRRAWWRKADGTDWGEGEGDFRERLGALPKGIVLYTVWAADDSGPAARLLGRIVLEAGFVASKYGDERLFFRHPFERAEAKDATTPSSVDLPAAPPARLVVLSDLHLGMAPHDFSLANAELPAALRALDPGPDLHLVLNGDTFDYLTDDGELSFRDAMRRTEQLLDENAAAVEALAELRRAGAKLTIRVGNHDPELLLAPVRAAIERRIPGVEFDGRPEADDLLPGARVLVRHGEEFDDFNRLHRDRAEAADDRGFPPGSQLVKSHLNPLRDGGLRFLDVLQPPARGAVTLAAITHPGRFPAALGPTKAAGWMARVALRKFGFRRAMVGGDETEGLSPAEADQLLRLLAAEDGASPLDFGEPQGLFGLGTRTRADLLRSTWRTLWGPTEMTADGLQTLEPTRAEWDRAEAVRDRADVVIEGHTHLRRFGVSGDGQTLINTGTWAPLMFLPRFDEPDAWAELLADLEVDPELRGPAARRRVTRFTAAQVTASGGRADAALLRWDPRAGEWSVRAGTGEPPRASIADGRTRPPTRRTGSSIEDGGLGERIHDARRRAGVPAGGGITAAQHTLLLVEQVEELLQVEPFDRRTLAAAQSVWKLYEDAEAQRIAHPRLTLADAIASDAWDALLARVEGWSPRELIPRPLCLVEPLLSPVTSARGSRRPMPIGLEGLDLPLPFPLVLLPPDHLERPGRLCAVLHEVGHDFDHELEISLQLREAVGPVGPWASWMSELVADLFGLGLAGPGYIAALAEIGGELEDPEHERRRGLGPHPPLPLRLRMLEAVLRHPEWQGPRGSEGTPAGGPELTQWAGEIAGKILTRPLGVESESGTQEVTLARLLRRDEGWETSLRSLPGRTQRIAAEAGAAAARKAFDGEIRRLRELDRRFDLREAHAKFAASAHRDLAPTIVSDPESLYKAPPPPLLEHYDRIVFVGATNGQLADMMAEARKQRDRGWEAVTVVFATDGELRRLYPEQADAKRQERDAARGALEGFLREHAGQHRLVVRDPGGLYGSFWERQREGEPRDRRAHVSAQVWGGELRESPGMDYREVGAETNRALRAYWAGMERLVG